MMIQGRTLHFWPVPLYRTTLLYMMWCETWTIKKAEHQRIDAFKVWCWRRLLRVPWTARRSNQSVKGNQPWIFTGRSGAEAEAPILWPPLWKRPWCWKRLKAKERRGQQRDEMVGWHRWLNGHEFEQLLSMWSQTVRHKWTTTTSNLNFVIVGGNFPFSISSNWWLLEYTKATDLYMLVLYLRTFLNYLVFPTHRVITCNLTILCHPFVLISTSNTTLNMQFWVKLQQWKWTFLPWSSSGNAPRVFPIKYDVLQSILPC